MKRWIVVLLVVIALLLLLSPGLVGRMAESSLDRNLDWVEERNPDLEITAERFDRGWFTSAGRHRVRLRKAPGLALVDAEPGAGKALIIDTRLDHGLVPFTSMGRERGSLKPGLASSVSTLSVDDGQGGIVELPGRLYSTIDIDGTATYRYLLDAGERIVDGERWTWSGADVTATTAPGSRRWTLAGRVEPATAEGDGMVTRLGAITIDATQDKRDFDPGTGSLVLDVASIGVDGDDGLTRGVGRFAVNAGWDVEAGRSTGNVVVTIDDLVTDGIGRTDLDAQFILDGADAEALDAYLAAAREAKTGVDPYGGAFAPAVRSALAGLVSRGLAARVPRFSLSLPEGDLEAVLDIDVAPQDGEFSWPSALLATAAEATLRIDESLYDFYAVAQPELSSLVATGYLRKTADGYELQARFAKGLLTVNGAPIPLPIAMPQ